MELFLSRLKEVSTNFFKESVAILLFSILMLIVFSVIVAVFVVLPIWGLSFIFGEWSILWCLVLIFSVWAVESYQHIKEKFVWLFVEPFQKNQKDED